MRRVIVALIGIALVTGTGVGLYRWSHARQDSPSFAGRPAETKPTLYCDFFNFMHAGTVASFYFAVDPGNGRDTPKYSELYVVENEGQRTDFGGPDQLPPPQWTYAIEEGTPVISSPDGATRIVLYGLKPKIGGVFWIEAGVRSNDYRNLEGKCRQAHYAAGAADVRPRP